MADHREPSVDRFVPHTLGSIRLRPPAGDFEHGNIRRLIVKQLNEALGIANWKETARQVARLGSESTTIVELSIKLNGDWVTRIGEGSSSESAFCEACRSFELLIDDHQDQINSNSGPKMMTTRLERNVAPSSELNPETKTLSSERGLQAECQLPLGRGLAAATKPDRKPSPTLASARTRKAKADNSRSRIVRRETIAQLAEFNAKPVELVAARRLCWGILEKNDCIKKFLRPVIQVRIGGRLFVEFDFDNSRISMNRLKLHIQMWERSSATVHDIVDELSRLLNCDPRRP
jgi:hypothetical protein